MKKGDKVHWKYGKGEGKGTIKQKFEKDVRKNIKGSEIKRKASKDEPAYLVEQDNGNQVLKSESELKK
jgi:hypothetical protein